MAEFKLGKVEILHPAVLVKKKAPPEELSFLLRVVYFQYLHMQFTV